MAEESMAGKWLTWWLMLLRTSGVAWFLRSHAVSDTLKDQLQAMGLKAAVTDGRTTSARKRC
ncbi:MAG: hypothetical protein IPG23_18990 [Burkholderiales bacterium]|nr:hypothetical protein [Burkholderiales bacterium]